ncbi:hypothetical protein F5882DRAFT_490977 [Hyaloscypha sp. PMI_1271]|nr:hypothetical protein F5882DRAFT_490977 [Hyaloscypha sp. PMI_1271]
MAISVWLALLINTIIICILSTAVFVPFKLTTFGLLSSHTKSIYVTGLTVLATICAAFSSAQIRHLWLRKIDVQLATPGIDFSTINTRWRTALGVSSLSEGLQRWHITCSFLISGLITAAIVAGLSSTLAQRQDDYIYYLADSQDYSCTITSETKPATAFNWLLSNGSYYSVHPNLDFCPGSIAMTLLGTINTVDPENYGYADGGVAVHESALGAPASIYTSRNNNSEVFNSLIGIYGQSLLSTSQCVPIMTKNPITCSRSANATYTGQYLTMTSPNGKCVNSVLVGSNLTWANTNTVRGICTSGSLGQATITIGGIMAGCIYLAEALGDSTWLDWWDSTGINTPETTYGITCTVDMAAALEYREVYLTLQQPTGSPGAYSRSLFVSSSEPCTPVQYSNSRSQSLNKLLALAATAAYQPLAIPWTDWARPLTINEPSIKIPYTSTNNIRPAPYAFSNSRNALEDILALTSALVLSRVTITGRSGQIAYVGQKTVQYTRAGSGETWALVYVLPSLFVIIVIIALLVNSRKNPGFSSEQLGDLVGLRFGE